ncbi:alpha/beta hydrolase [uncultured Agrococcus sp.]|uniref:alpha/beta fold hydrolase n=1 Tax=uncultured Agrococcus sp. TaxID=382258 RepID=UPI0025F90E13|nr:alpha/beta hydrolase [uncultured Agrococcus sp.]
MTEFDSRTDLNVLGGPVRLYRAGRSGPPVLLLHGAMLDTAHGVWHDVVPELANKHRVYVLDLPRHGDSRPWKGVLGDEFFTRFILELLNQLGLTKVALVGLSMGGGIAHRFALAHPSRVSALVAIEPGGVERKRPYQFPIWAVQRLPRLLRLSTWLLARSEKYLRSSMSGHLTKGPATPGFERIIALAMQEARRKHLHGEKALDDWQIESFGAFRMRYHSTPVLHRLTSPALWIVAGRSNGAIDPAAIAAAHDATPNSRITTIAEAGHIVPYDCPDELNEVIRDFFTEVFEESSEPSAENAIEENLE